MSNKTDERIDDLRARIDGLRTKFGAVEHEQAETADEENQALARVTRDYVNDLEQISRDLDETRTDARRRAEASRDELRHTPDRLAARLAELERKADELLKKARPGGH